MEEEVTTTVMETIIAAMADCFDLVGEVGTQITGQPVLLFLLAASLIPVGIGIFTGLRRAARCQQQKSPRLFGLNGRGFFMEWGERNEKIFLCAAGWRSDGKPALRACVCCQ